MNVLFITLDQLRGDCLSAAGHPLVRTPNLDRLAAEGVRFARHYSQAAPCGPGRACLYTGTYQFNNRVVANGTPLDDRFDNLARAARRAGYTPTLFGYTDQGIDPRRASGPGDPRLSTYEGVLPGFDVGLDLTESHIPWLAWLESLGYSLPGWADPVLESEGERPAEHGVSAFLTNHLIDWLERQDGPWFGHASYFRPHPPFAAAGHWSRAYSPDEVALPIPPADERHPLHEGLLQHKITSMPNDERIVRHVTAQYYGMISAVDAEIGRLCDTLRRLGQWDDTFIVLTSDHGEYLGNHGLVQKGGYFEDSYHVPCIVRDPRADRPRGLMVEQFTENVDLFPTLCEVMGIEVPAQCDGLPLTPFLQGSEPPWWRDAAHWEFDWRDVFLPDMPATWPWDRLLEQQHVAVLRDTTAAYVQFGDGSWRCFDLASDPTWRTETSNPTTVLPRAQEMLRWRSNHTERTMTGMLLRKGGIGRWPPALR